MGMTLDQQLIPFEPFGLSGRPLTSFARRITVKGKLRGRSVVPPPHSPKVALLSTGRQALYRNLNQILMFVNPTLMFGTVTGLDLQSSRSILASMRVLVCGGRDYKNREEFFSAMDNLLSNIPNVQIIEGGARGADCFAWEWAVANAIPFVTFKPNWERDGRAAGPIRNQRMLDEGKPELVIAFPGGAGTADMKRRARGAGIKVIEILPAEEETWPTSASPPSRIAAVSCTSSLLAASFRSPRAASPRSSPSTGRSAHTGEQSMFFRRKKPSPSPFDAVVAKATEHRHSWTPVKAPGPFSVKVCVECRHAEVGLDPDIIDRALAEVMAKKARAQGNAGYIIEAKVVKRKKRKANVYNPTCNCDEGDYCSCPTYW